MKTYKVKLIGETPVMLNNDQTADPLNPIAKEMKKISSKRAKTEADHYELSKLEWFGGLYLENKYELSAKLANLKNVDEPSEKIQSQIKAIEEMLIPKHSRIAIPARLLKANLIAGAKVFRKGSTLAKANPLILDTNGLNIPPRLRFVDENLSPEQLWEKKEVSNPEDPTSLFYPYRDRRSVVVQKSKVIRTRFICAQWSIEYLLQVSEEDFNTDDIISIIEKAGQVAGIGDYRTEYGKFSHLLEEV